MKTAALKTFVYSYRGSTIKEKVSLISLHSRWEGFQFKIAVYINSVISNLSANASDTHHEKIPAKKQ